MCDHYLLVSWSGWLLTDILHAFDLSAHPCFRVTYIYYINSILVYGTAVLCVYGVLAGCMLDDMIMCLLLKQCFGIYGSFCMPVVLPASCAVLEYLATMMCALADRLVDCWIVWVLVGDSA